MDVVTLPTSLNSQADVCVIADDLLRMVDGKSKQGTIYCVFTEDVVLQQPFKLFYYTKLKSVTQLNNDFIKNHGFPMWSDYHSASHPRMARRNGDYIKFNFFQGPNGRNDGIIYTWTDFHGGEHARLPTQSEFQLLRAPNRDNKNLYMTITAESTTVMLLSEKSFGSYLLMKENQRKIEKNHVTCMIVQDCSVAMTMFKKCGHAVCEMCWARNLIEKEKSNVTEIKCPSCQSFDVGRDQIIRLKLRQGPCPIDMCTPDASTYGAVLVPCGCRIHCKHLVDACTKYKNNPDDLARKLKSCPYDACKKMVEEVIPLKQG